MDGSIARISWISNWNISSGTYSIIRLKLALGDLDFEWLWNKRFQKKKNSKPIEKSSAPCACKTSQHNILLGLRAPTFLWGQWIAEHSVTHLWYSLIISQSTGHMVHTLLNHVRSFKDLQSIQQEGSNISNSFKKRVHDSWVDVNVSCLISETDSGRLWR